MGWLDGSFVFVFLVVRTFVTRVGRRTGAALLTSVSFSEPMVLGSVFCLLLVDGVGQLHLLPPSCGVEQFVALAASLDLFSWRRRAISSVDLDHSRVIVCFHSRVIVLKLGLKAFAFLPVLACSASHQPDMMSFPTPPFPPSTIQLVIASAVPSRAVFKTNHDGYIIPPLFSTYIDTDVWRKFNQLELLPALDGTANQPHSERLFVQLLCNPLADPLAIWEMACKIMEDMLRLSSNSGYSGDGIWYAYNRLQISCLTFEAVGESYTIPEPLPPRYDALYSATQRFVARSHFLICAANWIQALYCDDEREGEMKIQVRMKEWERARAKGKGE